MKISICLISFLTIVSCSEKDFSGTAIGGKKKVDTKSPPKVETADPQDSVSIDQSEGKIEGRIDIKEFYNKCWFAVSGTFVGYSGAVTKYGQNFREKLKSNQIGHNEIFDTVGGRFLHPREEPFVYGLGGREIDSAVLNSFDGIMVAPGMHVEIKDGAGTIVIDTDGPYIGIDVIWSNNISEYSKELRDDPPSEWIRDYFKGGKEAKGPQLRSGRWVKVTAIKDGVCDVKIAE